MDLKVATVCDLSDCLAHFAPRERPVVCSRRISQMATQRLLSIDEALAVIGTHVMPLPIEYVGLDDAYGRVLAEDLRAPLDLPPFDNSAMDGYALSASDTPGRLTIVGESAAG